MLKLAREKLLEEKGSCTNCMKLSIKNEKLLTLGACLPFFYKRLKNNWLGCLM